MSDDRSEQEILADALARHRAEEAARVAREGRSERGEPMTDEDLAVLMAEINRRAGR